MKKGSRKIPRISTRGYYDLSNGKKLKNNSYYLYPKKFFHKLYGKKELAIMIHGLRNDKAGAVSKFSFARKRLRQLGYPYPVIGYSYDANTKGAHLSKYALKALRIGQKIAKQNGKNLANFIVDFKQKSPQTKIRLLGHSLGTEVILSTIIILSQNSKNHGIIESAHFFGSSVPNNIANPRKNGRLIEKIIRTKLKNYYSPGDEVLEQSHHEGSVKNSLGYRGASGKTVSKYIQKRVYPKNHRFVSYASVIRSFP